MLKAAHFAKDTEEQIAGLAARSYHDAQREPGLAGEGSRPHIALPQDRVRELVRRRRKTRKKQQAVAVLASSGKRPGKILLVTSRNSKSWSLAKGQVDRRLGQRESARREAFEEAGVVGRLATAPIGTYIHRKSTGGTFRVRVFRMHVRDELSRWPERNVRRRRWVTVKSALDLISNPSLRRLIKSQF